MTELSIAAQAVRDAVLATYADNIPKDDSLWALERASTVAALRAAVDQMRYSDQLGLTGFGGYVQAQDQILAIADELEAQ
jgi:hypothetical protein